MKFFKQISIVLFISVLGFSTRLLSMSSSSSSASTSSQTNTKTSIYEAYDRDSKRKSPDQVRSEYHDSQNRLEQALAAAPKTALAIIHHIIDKKSLNNPEFRSVFFIGPKGTGKTTLAKAIAYKAGAKCSYLPFSVFKKGFRDQTAICLKEKLDEIIAQCATAGKIVIIIDEINRLFENFDSKNHDADSTAATFWLFLDEQIAKGNEDFFIIGTMNRADKIPSQIQSRHQMGYIYFKPLTVNQLKKLLLDVINESHVQLAENYSDEEITAFATMLQGWSARDIHHLIGQAKLIFRRSNQTDDIVLNKRHLLRAKEELDLLNKEIYKSDQIQETEQEQRERQFVQSQLIHAVVSKNQSGGVLSDYGYKVITNEFISQEQRTMLENYLEKTRKEYRDEQERKKQEEERKKNEGGCIIQ